MNKKNVFISAIESGLSLSKRFLFCLTLGLGILLAVLGLGGFIVTCLAHKAQSISLYLYFLLLFYFGLFISYRGWVGQKAMKAIKTNLTDNDWVAVRAYPTTFWSYIRRAFFNPRDMGIGAGIVIFYGCFILILLLDDDVKTPIHSVLILLFILFFLWELVVSGMHWKFWKTVWNEGPLMIRLNDEGLSFIMPYNINEEGEVILVGDDRFDSWDDSNHCLVTDHMDWKDIRRVDFFSTYLKLSTFWRSYTVFYNDSDLKDNGSLLRQITALNFLRHQENTQKVTINTINHLFTGLERLAISMNSTDKGEMIVGDSKFGGEPDVAKEFTWPTTDDNRPLSFVFQVNLKDVSTYDKKHMLPSSGMLYFFYDLEGVGNEELSEKHIEDWWQQHGDDNYFRLIYVDCTRNDLHPFDDDGQIERIVFKNEERLIFETEKSLPDYRDVCLEKENVEEDTYQWMADIYCHGEYPRKEQDNWRGSLLGYASYYDEPIDYGDRLLFFQIDLYLDDDARIYCFLPREDIKKADFSHAFFELQTR